MEDILADDSMIAVYQLYRSSIRRRDKWAAHSRIRTDSSDVLKLCQLALSGPNI